MGARERFLWLALATVLALPAEAGAKGRSGSASTPAAGPPPRKQGRRLAVRGADRTTRTTSPCGRHVVHVAGGVVFLDGKRIHPGAGVVDVVALPRFRKDGRALAWLERSGGEARLVVIPDVATDPRPWPWALPDLAEDESLFWAGRNRVVVGRGVLAPRIVASWNE
jgi:hypothetical protein